MAAERLERYRSIVPDWPDFVEALARPLPLCLWTNTLRASPDEVAGQLRRAGVEADTLHWHAGAFKGAPSRIAGRSMPFVAGLYHIQEEVSLLPVLLLAPRRNERVIDLCSAPGNKTAQMAVAMHNSGTIVANDRDGYRARATRGILDRLGIINTTITTADASNMSESVGRFDRVLADVPCTCEGTTRKHIDALLQSGREASLRLHHRQLAILRKAVRLCRPGGLIAYATCTYAPEENEMVVDAVLRETNTELVPARIRGIASSEGLTEWDGRRFDPSMRRAMRVWPHQNDSGGFFVALLRPLPDAAATPSQDVPTVNIDTFSLQGNEEEVWLGLLRDRFGFPSEVFSGMRLHAPNTKYVAAVSDDHETIEQPDPVSIGMPLIRVGLRYPKLTTAGARLLGSSAARNVVHADAEQAREYMKRDDFVVTSDQARRIEGTGYVLVEHAQTTLGVGLYLEDHYTVKSMFPKVLSRAVSD